MKNTIPALLLLALLLGLCLFNGAAVREDSLRWQETLRQADAEIRAEQWDKAAQTLAQSYTDWLRCQPRLRILITHSLLHEADCLYRRVIAFTSVQDSGELLADLSALIRQLDLLAQREQLTISNIL